jgi:hypothetical protein
MDSVLCNTESRNWNYKDGYDIYNSYVSLESRSYEFTIGSIGGGNGTYFFNDDVNGGMIRIEYDEAMQQIDSFYYADINGFTWTYNNSTVVSAGDIPIVEKDNYISFDIRGEMLKNIRFDYVHSYRNVTDAGGSIKGNMSLDTFTNASHVKFRIRKHYLSSVRSTSKESSNLRAFPNPCSNYVSISVPKQNHNEAKIYNSFGQVVLSLDREDSNDRINISTLPAGIYFLRAGSRQEKLVIRR